jgi:hypothetical protein
LGGAALWSALKAAVETLPQPAAAAAETVAHQLCRCAGREKPAHVLQVFLNELLVLQD